MQSIARDRYRELDKQRLGVVSRCTDDADYGAGSYALVLPRDEEL